MKTILNAAFLLISFSCFAAGHPVHKTYKSVPLKGGYTLAYKQFDSINYLCLIKDGKETEIPEHESDTNMQLDVLGYLYADFANAFVVATHIGADPIKVEIVDKKTGNIILYGATPFYTDTVHNLMMFEGTYRRAGKLILYDFNTGKAEQYFAPRDTHCFCCFCWKLITINDASFTIEYINTKKQEAIITYARKIKNG